jgi:hypothetical protein
MLGLTTKFFGTFCTSTASTLTYIKDFLLHLWQASDGLSWAKTPI